MKHIKLFEEFINEAAITSDKIKEYYSAICKAEGVDEIPLRFETIIKTFNVNL